MVAKIASQPFKRRIDIGRLAAKVEAQVCLPTGTKRNPWHQRDFGVFQDVVRQAARVARPGHRVFHSRKHEVGALGLLVVEDVRQRVEVLERAIAPFLKGAAKRDEMGLSIL